MVYLQLRLVRDPVEVELLMKGDSYLWLLRVLVLLVWQSVVHLPLVVGLQGRLGVGLVEVGLLLLVGNLVEVGRMLLVGDLVEVCPMHVAGGLLCRLWVVVNLIGVGHMYWSGPLSFGPWQWLPEV